MHGRNATSLRPEKTQRAIAARSATKPTQNKMDAPPEPIDAEAPGVTPVTVWIYPRPEGSWQYPNKPTYRIEPQDYWPTEDEAPWPDLNSSDALQELAEEIRTPQGQLGEAFIRFIEEADDDGLLDRAEGAEFDDPWTGLVAMQAEYASTVLQTGLWPKTGTVDFGNGLDIAHSIIDKWPDDPAAEYARLHLLQLANHSQSTRYNAAETMDWIVDIIETTQDGLVLDVAIGEFTAIHDSPFNDRTIEAIASVYQRAEINTQRGIIATMLNHHAHNNNWDQVDAWTTRLLEHDQRAPQDHADAASETAQSIASDLAGYRAVRGALTPSNWREEVSAAVHLCHEDHPIDHSIGAEAEWNDGWQWNAWWKLSLLLGDSTNPTESPHFIECIQSTDWQHDPPPTVLLTIKVIR